MTKPLILFLLFGAGLGALALTVFFLRFPAEHPFVTKLLRVHGAQQQSDPYILLRLTKPGTPIPEFADEQAMQFKSAGKWLPREKLEGIMLYWIPGSRNIAVIPTHPGAEALRLDLTFRPQSPRDAAANWLVARGCWGRAPRFSHWLCDRLPWERRWRQAAIEVELPHQPCWSAAESFEPGPNLAPVVDGAVARLLALRREWQSATEPCQ